MWLNLVHGGKHRFPLDAAITAVPAQDILQANTAEEAFPPT